MSQNKVLALVFAVLLGVAAPSVGHGELPDKLFHTPGEPDQVPIWVSESEVVMEIQARRKNCENLFEGLRRDMADGFTIACAKV